MGSSAVSIPWAFLGGFAAVVLVMVIVGVAVYQNIRRYCRQFFGMDDLMEIMDAVNEEEENRPRSLNGCDRMLLPDILRDFPDFDVTMAKTYTKEYLRKELKEHEPIEIYNVVIARYLPSAVQKTIIFQAAVSYRENGRTQQKRYDISYSYLNDSGDKMVAANCPNCGAVLGYGQTVCTYCGSRVVNVMGNTWKFTELKES